MGFIDRLAQNIETGELEIHDYKTANSLPTKEKIETDRQLALYSIAIQNEFGEDKKICLIWHYLAHDKKICSKRTKEQLEKLKKDTIELIKKIESTHEFPTNKSRLCDWCEYKSMCPEFGGSIEILSRNKEKQTGLDKYPTTSKYIKGDNKEINKIDLED